MSCGLEAPFPQQRITLDCDSLLGLLLQMTDWVAYRTEIGFLTLGGSKTTTEVLVGSISNEYSLPTSQMATFSLCSHMPTSLCMWRKEALVCLPLLGETSFPMKDMPPLG